MDNVEHYYFNHNAVDDQYYTNDNDDYDFIHDLVRSAPLLPDHVFYYIVYNDYDINDDLGASASLRNDHVFYTIVDDKHHKVLDA